MNRIEPSETKPLTRRLTLRIGIAIALILTVPLLLFFGLFPLIQERPFDSVDELEPGQIQRLEVRMYNRTELDGGNDVGPYIADPAEYERLLQPLLGVSEVSGYDGARGPWLGEYRILLKNGRKGTVRFYWVPNTGESPIALVLGSVAGAAPWKLAMFSSSIPTPSPRLRFEIGLHKYELPEAKVLIEAAERGSTSGVRRPR